MKPLVSIILPVYNAQAYLAEAIESILYQTYSNFEFIIINDGSSDKSEELILSYNDPRIKYVFQSNKGLGATLNVGLALAKGTYIARQDQDDISHKERLEKQVDFLEQHKNILLLGTRARIFENTGSVIKYHNHATHPADLKFDLLFDNPFVHSSVMYRTSVVDEIGGYNPDRNLYEDYDLWSRIAAQGDVANLNELLVDYRHHEKGLSKDLSNFKEDALYNQGVKNLEMLLGIKNEDLNYLIALYHSKKKIYKGSPVKKLKAGLNLIADKLTELYPLEKRRIEARKDQYLKIIMYRLNVIKREKYQSNPLRVLFLKIESKVLKLQSEIKNT